MCRRTFKLNIVDVGRGSPLNDFYTNLIRIAGRTEAFC